MVNRSVRPCSVSISVTADRTVGQPSQVGWKTEEIPQYVSPPRSLDALLYPPSNEEVLEYETEKFAMLGQSP